MMALKKDDNRKADVPSRPTCIVPGSEDASDLRKLTVPTNRFPLSKKIEDWNKQVLQEGWTIQMPGDSSIRSALQRGCEIVQNGGSVIIGMSLGNSYFTEANLTRLFRFLQIQKTEIYLLVMDKPSEHNYRALGYSEGQIFQNIKRKSAKICRALESALDQVDYAADHFHILNWETIQSHKAYQIARGTLDSLYLKNESFRKDVRSAVAAYLAPKLKSAAISEERHASADRYLLEELAFLICSQEFLSRSELAYLYHREWSIFERLITGIYDQNLSSSLGFVELEVQSLVG